MIKALGVFFTMSVSLFAQGHQVKQELFSPLREHFAKLSDESQKQRTVQHLDKTEAIAKSLVKLHQSGKPTAIIMVCTGNSRRSMMGAAMGNAAAAFYGISDVRFYSGGTSPSAFNPRAIKALEEIGFVIKPKGKNAVKGSKGEENPIYSLAWGEGERAQTEEFSKVYSDPFNPQHHFVALMVCDDANKQCPVVKGAVERFAIPFEDPKKFDGTTEESSRYAERRDDLGRFMLKILKRVKALEDAKQS